MRNFSIYGTTFIVLFLLLTGCGGSPDEAANPLLFEGEERYFRNVRQLTFGGENAEAYFSPDESKLIFQSTRPPYEADQIFSMNIQGENVTLLSTGLGRTTCAYYYPGGERFLYASTHLGGDEPPEPVTFKDGRYVWPVYETYDIFSGTPGGELTRLTDAPGYDAEATIAPDGSKIIFTSARDGDLELYTMNPDGSEQTRLTNSPGYDGGAFYSFDSERIVFRGHHPQSPEELEEYRNFLEQGLVVPTRMDLFVMDADGSNLKQITDNGAANFAPFFHPDGERIIFSSNVYAEDPQKRNFDLYMINIDGTGLERLTYSPDFDGFPMFTRDGRTLVFCSNRNQKIEGETNVFITEFLK